MAVPAGCNDVERVCQALLRTAARLCASLARVRDPSARAVGVWSIAETAAHLSLSSPYFLRAAQQQVGPEALCENAQTTVRAVANEPERDLRRLARRIVAGESALVAYARGRQGNPIVAPFQGTAIPLSGLLGVELCELVVHGFDITRAAGLPWHVPPEDAAPALAGAVQVLPVLLDRTEAAGLRVRCALHIRHGSTVVIVVEHAALQLEPPSGRAVDCRLTVDPLTFLLLSFHRIDRVGAVMRGKVVPWGRRPWLVPRLQAALMAV